MTANRIGTIRKIGVTLGLAFSISAAATPSSFAYSARAQQMCTGDAMRLCSSEIPNVSRIIACMRRNKANVSAGCRAVMEQEDPASRPKPAAAIEQKPPAAARAEQPAPVRPKPVPAATVEQKPAAAPPVVQPAAAETKPAAAVAFEQKTMAVTPVEQQRPRVNPFRHLSGQKPAALSILARASVTEARPVQGVTAEQSPATVAPVMAIETKSVRSAPAATTAPAAAAPAVVKPVEVKSAPVAKPVKVVQRKQRPRVAVAAYTPREGGGYERYISMAAPIMSLIMSNW